MLDKKPNEAHVETCGAGYSEYAMCDSPEACADLRNDPVVECTGCPEPATKICTHCHDPKCDDCMPAFLCCACDEEADDA